MNIYIIGVATSGKSTLTKILKKRKPEINVFSFEAVRNGFIRAQPDLKMGDRNSEARKDILPAFMIEMAKWNNTMTGQISVVEGSFASVERLMPLISSDDIVICLGYDGKRLDEIATMAITQALPTSYLRGKTEQEFKAHFYDLEKDDRDAIEKCQEYNIRRLN